MDIFIQNLNSTIHIDFQYSLESKGTNDSLDCMENDTLSSVIDVKGIMYVKVIIMQNVRFMLPKRINSSEFMSPYGYKVSIEDKK